MKQNMKRLFVAALCFGLGTIALSSNGQMKNNSQEYEKSWDGGLVTVTGVQVVKQSVTSLTNRSGGETVRIQEIPVPSSFGSSETSRQRCFQIYGACGTWNIWVSGGSHQAAYEHAQLYYNIVLCY